MISLTVDKVPALTIAEQTFKHILNLYPEEGLIERDIFASALENRKIEFSKLQDECDKICVPWQLFLLNKEKLKQQLDHIEEQRKFKISPKLFRKRKGLGNITSKRIVDRLIRQQNFLLEQHSYPVNTFCGSLKNLSVKNAAAIIHYKIGIDRPYFWARPTKTKALEYLIQTVEAKNIIVSRGVLQNKVLPQIPTATSVYKNTSGFCIKDDRIPIIFLPSETNPDEVLGRQIYTIIYLLTAIGLYQFDLLINKNFNAKKVYANNTEKIIHKIVSEVLLPDDEIKKFKHKKFNSTLCDELCTKYKVSLKALLLTLKIRKFISQQEYEDLSPPEYNPKASNIKRTGGKQKITNSIRNFCGPLAFDVINKGLQNGTLNKTQAQYLIFGTINKKKFREYRIEAGV